MSFQVRFWGVRGSIACPTETHIGYGGNTSCVEFNVDGRLFIMDAGTGLRQLGLSMIERGIKEAKILLSHTHWDHINGFPFFMPAFMADNRFDIYSGHMADADGGIRQVFAGQMAQPFFPVPLEAMQGELHFHDFDAGETLQFDDIEVVTTLLHHPNNSTGYRVNYKGASACYVTDTEHTPGQLDQNILNLIEGADLVIYDSTYTEEEFPNKIGWGHSTWEEGVRLCEAAGAKKLVVFHHDPTHDDDFLAKMGEAVAQRYPNSILAKEGLTLPLL